MPKLNLKPKKILSRLVLGKPRKEEDGMHYLCLGFERHLFELHSHAYVGNDDDNADDCSSIVSFSTTATANDLPGTGRFIDTYIFQPMGRRIERLAMRFTIASLHPARIAQYIETDWTLFDPGLDWTSLHEAIAELCYSRGSTVVAGMKGLVKQTQSNYINRSAVALAALVRVSLTINHRVIYDKVSRIEPIFHLETLAGSLDCSHPEKLLFLLLVKLARATLTAIRDAEDLVEEVFDPFHDCVTLQLTPLLRQASDLRRRLRRVLNMYKFSRFAALDTMLGEACDICAVAVSTCIQYCARGDPYMHILETVYLTVIFILRSINELAGYSTVSPNKMQSVVLRTLASWIDMIVFQCLFATDCMGRFSVCMLHACLMFRSVALVVRPLLRESLNFTNGNILFDVNWLPRRQRATAGGAEGNPILQRLVKISIERTRRLLVSFSELEREAQGNSAGINGFSQLKITANYFNFSFHAEFGEGWWDSWEDTLEQAWRVHVPDNELTREFREARRIGSEHSSNPDDRRFGGLYQDERNWGHYSLRKIVRHQMGQHFRSNMDWDWDLGTCMNHLFKVEWPWGEPSTAAQIPPTASPEIDMSGSAGETWKISAGQAQGVLPKEVQIAYETESGETHYMSFVPAFPNPGCLPGPETANVGTFGEEESHPKSDSRHGKGSSGGEEEGENLMDGSSSSEASQPEARADALFEKSIADCEGKEREYDAGFDEVQEGGDAISICSLD